MGERPCTLPLNAKPCFHGNVMKPLERCARCSVPGPLHRLRRKQAGLSMHETSAFGLVAAVQGVSPGCSGGGSRAQSSVSRFLFGRVFY